MISKAQDEIEEKKNAGITVGRAGVVRRSSFRGQCLQDMSEIRWRFKIAYENDGRFASRLETEWYEMNE